MTDAATATAADTSPRRTAVPVWIPIVLIASYGLGVSLIILAYQQAQHSNGFGHFTVFWLGVAAILIVTVIAGFRLPAAGWFLPAVLLAVAVVTFLPKFLMSPGGPIYFDEFAHLRHAQDVLATGDFGVHNDLLPVIQYYPGLSAATLGVHFLTGLGLWHAGQVVIGIAHCASLLLVFALARRVGLGQRAAFFAGLIYALNPGYMYFDSQYAYESLAIALLLATAVCTAAARRGSTPRAVRRWSVGGVLLALATVLTHHVSSAVMAVLCLLLAAFLPAAETEGQVALVRAQRIGAWTVAGVGFVSAGLWNVGISSQTRVYLLSGVSSSFSQLFALFSPAGRSDAGSGGGGSAGGGGAADSHTLFSGTSVPFYEGPLAYAVPLIVLGLVVLNAVRIRRSPTPRDEARRAAPFGIFSLAYLASLPLALTATGNQLAHRSWPFFFIGVAVFSVWTFGRRRSRRAHPGQRPAGRSSFRTTAVASLLIMVTAVGNVSAGANVAYRFPGPYVFGQDHRFETRELNDLVAWSAKHLPRQARVVTDRFTAQALLVGSTLHIATNNESFSSTLFDDPMNPSPQLRQFLRQHGFRYFILDRRIVEQEPVQVFYQGYEDYTEESLKLLANIKNNSFIEVVHKTANYSICKIDP